MSGLSHDGRYCPESRSGGLGGGQSGRDLGLLSYAYARHCAQWWTLQPGFPPDAEARLGQRKPEEGWQGPGQRSHGRTVPRGSWYPGRLSREGGWGVDPEHRVLPSHPSPTMLPTCGP